MITVVHYITSEISNSTLEKIFFIRKMYYYPDSSDEQYWNGGIQVLLNEDSLIKSHNDDPSSKFLLLFDDRKNLIAYSRFSINQKTINDYLVSKIHILAVDKNHVGSKIIIDSKETKIGTFILNTIISESTYHNSDIIVSEICVFPYPNLPSLIIHKKFNFISIASSLKIMQRKENDSNSFLILGKYLNTKKRIIFNSNDF